MVSNKLAGMKFLVVEDDNATRLLVSRMLHSQGAAIVVQASNGIEAVVKAREDKYDMIVMDVSLPILGGIEATEAIRGEGNQTPIVALSGSSNPQLIVRAIRAGCNDYIVKGFKGSHKTAPFQAVAHLSKQLGDAAKKQLDA